MLVIILLIISGIAKAIMDTSNFHYQNSYLKDFKKGSFWNHKISSNNKYLNGKKENGPRFIGSTTFLVWVTDAWHLFQMIYGVTFATSFLLIGSYYPLLWAVLAYAFQRFIFEITFRLLEKH